MPAKARVIHPPSLAHHTHLLAVVVTILILLLVVIVRRSCASPLLLIVAVTVAVIIVTTSAATVLTVAIVSVVAIVTFEAATTTIAAAIAIVIVAMVAAIPSRAATVAAIAPPAMLISIVVVVATTATTIVISIVMMIITSIAPVSVVSSSLRVVSFSMGIVDQRSISVLHLSILATVLAFSPVGCLGCVLPDFITDLATSSTSTKLSVWLKSIVPVNSNNAPVENRSIESVHSESCLSPRGILNKAEAAWLHLDTIQSHDQVDHLATCGEKLEQLTFEGEKGQIAYIQSR